MSLRKGSKGPTLPRRQIQTFPPRISSESSPRTGRRSGSISNFQNSRPSASLVSFISPAPFRVSRILDTPNTRTQTATDRQIQRGRQRQQFAAPGAASSHSEEKLRAIWTRPNRRRNPEPEVEVGTEGEDIANLFGAKRLGFESLWGRGGPCWDASYFRPRRTVSPTFASPSTATVSSFRLGTRLVSPIALHFPVRWIYFSVVRVLPFASGFVSR